MQTLTMDKAQQIHINVFGCDASDRDILRYLQEAEETLVLCKETITSDSVSKLLTQWFEEEKMENDAAWRSHLRLMLDDA